MLPTNPLLNATAPAGPHLPVSLLRQYAAGTLAPAAQHRVEAHTLACPRCADLLAGLQQTPPATTDQALAQLQQRLRQRVQQQAAPARHDREGQRNRWLIPQLAAAAALLLGLVAGGWWAWQQRHRSETAEVATALAPVVPTPAVLSPVPPAAEAPTGALLPPSQQRFRAAPARAAQRPATNHRPPHAHRKPPLAEAAATAPAAAPIPATPAEPSVTSAAPLANAPAPMAPDSLAGPGRVARRAARTQADTYAAPLARMPAAPKLPPTPVGGYSALREKLRREATEFKPEAPEQPLSGTVQLRLTIGADGKIQQTKVLR
ncbi:MAG: zf-HC2 domain-containing protein, partial [Hymenobacter sp.]